MFKEKNFATTIGISPLSTHIITHHHQSNKGRTEVLMMG
jgi:hypothetical protein